MSAEGRSLNRKLSHFSVALGGLASAIVLPLYAVKVSLKHDYMDFDVYYKAASRVAAGRWDEVYNWTDGASPFRYAPATLFFFRPFAALSHDAARLAWYFLQYAWFGFGFYFIYRTLLHVLTRANRSGALAVTSLSLLFVLRFCLDCFTIGQISSLLFLAFCASLYFWVASPQRKTGWGSVFLSLPALVKIGPAFLYPLFLHGRPGPRKRAILRPIAVIATVLGLSTLWIGSLERNRMLWRGWLGMVQGDSTYYDASHYGSQSMKSALLRLAKSGWLTEPTAVKLYALASIFVCASILGFWLWRTPRRPLGRALAFSLGLFAYLWVMPETFKYSLTVLAVPVSFLTSSLIFSRRCNLTLFALIFGTLTLSLAGKDIIGDTLFFGSQRASVPLLATFFLGAATAIQAWKESRDSWIARETKAIFASASVHPLAPYDGGTRPSRPEISLLAPLAMHSKVSLDVNAVLVFLKDLHSSLRAAGKSFEFLIQPYGDRLSLLNPLWLSLQELSREMPELKLSGLDKSDCRPLSRNAALRECFARSNGSILLTAQLEQPCRPEFYTEAIRLLENCDWVRGNRRQAETRFRIPVRLLPIVYRRHRLGLWFNRLVRAALPVRTTDTHSGIHAFSRSFASKAFALQSSMDFLFDLELAVIAETHDARARELPLRLHLAEEKTHRRMAFEAFNIAIGLPRLALRLRNGCYSPLKLQQRITADDWGMSPEVNRGILDLAQRGIVKRVSIMAKTAYAADGLETLKAIPGIELGLHFDLTFSTASPGEIMKRWMIPSEDRDEIKRSVRAEFELQMRRMRELKVPIQYLDGHHHIHLVPGVLDALADLIRAEGIRTLRLPYDPSLWLTRKFSLNILSLLARGKLRRLGFSSLPCFYPRGRHFLDPGRLRASLLRHEGAEVIVHPARSNDFALLKIPDGYTDGRVIEYRALRMLELS